MAYTKVFFLVVSLLVFSPVLFVFGFELEEPGLLNLTTQTTDSYDKVISLEDNNGQQPSGQWMLPNNASRIFVWVIGFIALIGNAFVLIWRCAGKGTENPVQIHLISNLALSDLLMSLYMLTIASADMYFNQGFSLEAESWNSGIVCKVVSVISVLAGEASMLFLTLISVDRITSVAVIYPCCRRLRLSNTIINISTVLIWSFAVVLAVVPNVYLGTSTIQSDICIKLPLIKAPDVYPNTSQASHDTIASTSYKLNDNVTMVNKSSHQPSPIIADHPMSMYFMISIYLGFNSICLVIVATCYTGIFYIVWKSSHKLGITRAKIEVRLCIRMGLIVLTNFVTWLPIVITGILVQMELIYLSANAYIFIIIFLLPINSAVNPYLYTFSIIILDFWDHRNYKEAKRKGTLPSLV